MRLFDSVDRASVAKRELQLSILSIVSIVILAAGMVVLMYPSISNHPAVFTPRTSKEFFFGFCALCLLLVVYLIDRQFVVQRLRREIAQGKVQYSELRRRAGQDLLTSLAGLNRFQDRLIMEFRRAVNGGDTLSVMVIRLTPAPGLAGEEEMTVALGDAVTAMSRKLRREDSLYHFTAGAFGIILPGTGVKDARLVSARLAEGLSDAAGATIRFSSDIKFFNYPQHAATAHELEQSVRSLLPEDAIADPVVADSLAAAQRPKN